MIKRAVLFTITLVCLTTASSIIGTCSRVVSDTASTVYNEVKPQSLLNKYTEFKNIHARLSAMQSTIETLETTRKSTIETYGSDASKYPRDVRQDLASAAQEIAGTKAAFNRLASEYNANLAKINYRFCNVGDLPAGAVDPLPREYITYISK